MQTADIQARIRQGQLHIQGAGPPTNRAYGVAVDVEVPQELRVWLREQEHPHESLYPDSEQAYAPATAELTEENLEIVIEGEPLNDERGARIVTSDLTALVTFVESYEG